MAYAKKKKNCKYNKLNVQIILYLLCINLMLVISYYHIKSGKKSTIYF